MENMNDKVSQGKTSAASKPKKERVAREESRKVDRKLISACVSVMVAFVLFIIMVTVEYRVVNQVETRNVVVAKKNVPMGVIFTKENISLYFGVEQRNANEQSASVCTDLSCLEGKSLLQDISKKEIVSRNMLTEGALYDGIEEPVEIAIELSKIGQAVGGVLRAGDLINIHSVVEVGYNELEEGSTDEDVSMIGIDEVSVEEDMVVSDENIVPEGMDEGLLTNELQYSITGNYMYVLIGENIRVTNAFTSAGLNTEDAESEGVSQVTTVINIVIPRSMEKDICLALEEGTLRLSKVVKSSSLVQEVEVSETLNEDNVQDLRTIEATEAVSMSVEEILDEPSIEQAEVEETEESVSETLPTDVSNENSAESNVNESVEVVG